MEQAPAKMEQIKKTYRFEFTSEVMDLIKHFAIVHQFDERKIYKEQWNNWYNENKEEMEREIRRMNDIGYVGDVKDKMFKAGRYYFRKKNIKNKAQVEQAQQPQAQQPQAQQPQAQQPQAQQAQAQQAQAQQAQAQTKDKKKSRNYITMLEATLTAMDEHIKTALAKEADFKPSAGYSQFCENNVLILRTEIQRMVVDNIMDKKDIAEKIKKTYKNRYFMLTRN
jgi:hypothetical protein